MSVEGKKLLILGGTSASLDLVKNAKEMGVYTIVTDEAPVEERVAKQVADEVANISTTDFDGLIALIRERGIDGVFCGPSEFNLRNLFVLCEMAGLPCYATTELWNRCGNKKEFKEFCIQNGVDCPREYLLCEDSSDEELKNADYPLIVKPVDGSSSAGISVCNEWTEVRQACAFARSKSASGKIVVEKFIEGTNSCGELKEGALFGARYILRDGEAYPYLLIDTYVVNPDDKKGLISAYTETPSKRADYYMEHMDANVRKMMKSMGLKNGVAFFQSLPSGGKIYIHEMGYRLSGGFLYKLSNPLSNVHDMQMMIRFALGEEIATDEELSKVRLVFDGKIGAQLMCPLKPGTISEISGLDEIRKIPELVDFIQYYKEGDTVSASAVGTLSQHFGRFTLIADDRERVQEIVCEIQSILRVKDTDGNIMNCYPFNFERTKM